MTRRTAVAVAALFAAASALPADHGPGEILGTVSFPTSCKPEVQPAFERAVALLHSFGYEVAREAFQHVAEDDPGCAMAHWGVAMTLYHPLWTAPTPAELADGKAAADRAAALAKATGSKSTDRERAYIAAISQIFTGADVADHKTRAARYRDAMTALAQSSPEDVEATIFSAVAMLGTAPPTDTTRAQQRKAADLLVPLVTRFPNHPGIAHYMIHSLDYPELAAQGLDAARRYARIAPGSAHALHMPSHVFVRLGLWPEAIASNVDSEASARELAPKYPATAAHNALHALDYQVYAYLQVAQDAEARTALAEAVELAALSKEQVFTSAYAVAAMPARFALEREQWKEAAALPLGLTKGAASDAASEQQYAYVPAITWFARALGAARSGDVAGAEAALVELAARQKKLAQSPPPGPYDWAGHVESQRLAAAGWIERAKGNDTEAEKLLTAAADLEERVGKHPVTPGSVLPARELLGDLLLELGRPLDALAAYELSLVQAPNRLRSLQGAARAAGLAGEADRARTLRNLVSAMTAAGQPRVALAKAGGG